jgi:hypothetical protein
MMCTNSKRQWTIERRQVNKVIAKHRAYYTALQILRDEIATVEVELRNLNVIYTILKDDIRGIVLQLGFTKK